MSPLRAESQAAGSSRPGPDRILALVLAGFLLVGLAVHRDFGLSWDEPLFYAYADAVPYAYTPSAWVSGDFDLEQAYGPSGDDHKVYGPAYLLAARPVVGAWRAVSGDASPEAWHLVNFTMFLVGAVGLYGLLRRWVGGFPAIAAVLLFVTQPLLWGHAFINPKDIPFLVAFVWSILLGLRMIDRLVAAPPPTRGEPPHLADDPPETPPERPSRALRGWALGLTGAILAIGILGYALAGQVEDRVKSTVLNAYFGPPERLLPRLFRAVAQDAANLSEDYYIERALSILHTGRAASLLAGLIGFPWAAAAWIPPGPHDVARRRRSGPGSAAVGGPTLSARHALLPGIVLGLTSSLRVLGPLAGLLIAGRYLTSRRRPLLPLMAYAGAAVVAMVVTWPYLWSSPLLRLWEVIQRSAHNPAILTVLFEGQLFTSNTLPDSYLPTLLATTLTEPVWPLAFLGVAIGFSWVSRRRMDAGAMGVLLLWLALPVGYVVLLRPPLYDSFRHFLFMLPPIFVFIGVSLQELSERVSSRTWPALLAGAALLPGLIGIARLHPYPYAYFNSFVGGPAGAFRRYEADYWLTCYKEAMESIPDAGAGRTVFVPAQPSIAAVYAPPGLSFEKLEPSEDHSFPGAWLLLPTRENMDLEIHPQDPQILEVGRLGASYCVIRQVPERAGSG